MRTPCFAFGLLALVVCASSLTPVVTDSADADDADADAVVYKQVIMKVNMIGYTATTFNDNTRAALRSSLAIVLAVDEEVIELGADDIEGETDPEPEASYGSADDEGGSAGSYGSAADESGSAGIDDEDGDDARRLNVNKHLAVDVSIRAVHGSCDTCAQTLHTNMIALQTHPQLKTLKQTIKAAVETAGDDVPTGFAVKIPTVGALENFVPPSTLSPTASPTSPTDAPTESPTSPTDAPTAVPEETAEEDAAEKVAATLYPSLAPTEAPVVPPLPVLTLTMQLSALLLAPLRSQTSLL